MTVSYIDEIMEQPAMLQALAKGLPTDVADDLARARSGLLAGEFDRILMTGMGGSLHGAHPLFLQLSQSSPVPVLLADASELVQQMPEAIGRCSLVIAISQSGASGEIIELTKNAARSPGTVVSVTNMADNPLWNWADIRLCSNAGPELTVSSKSYTGGLACLHLLGGALSNASGQVGKDLAKAADACERLLARWQIEVAAAAKFLDPKAPVVFVGRGKSLGSARLAALLTQEAAKLPCTALSGGQFHHGPIELVRDGFQMIIFLGDHKTREIDESLMDKVLGLNGRILAIAPAGSVPSQRKGLHLLTYPDVPVPLNPIMEAVLVQLLQIPLAEARGFKAGAFLNATKITGVI